MNSYERITNAIAAALSGDLPSWVAKHRRDSRGGRTGSRLRVHDVCELRLVSKPPEPCAGKCLMYAGKPRTRTLDLAHCVRSEIAGDIAAGTHAMLTNHRCERFARAA